MLVWLDLNDQNWHGKTGGEKHVSRVIHAPIPGAGPSEPKTFGTLTYAKTV